MKGPASSEVAKRHWLDTLRQQLSLTSTSYTLKRNSTTSPQLGQSAALTNQAGPTGACAPCELDLDRDSFH